VNHSLAQFPIEVPPRGQFDHARKVGAIVIFGASLLLASATASGLCILCSCTITSTAISFGNYDPLSATALASTGTLGFSCNFGVSLGGINFTISLAPGGSGTYATRTLKSGSNTLNYNLYTTVLDTTVWGDGTSGTATVTASYPFTNAPPVNVTVYALIPAQQNAISGSYSDSITATVTF
jgi:spore coat protein U-like protein